MNFKKNTSNLLRISDGRLFRISDGHLKRISDGHEFLGDGALGIEECPAEDTYQPGEWIEYDDE